MNPTSSLSVLIAASITLAAAGGCGRRRVPRNPPDTDSSTPSGTLDAGPVRDAGPTTRDAGAGSDSGQPLCPGRVEPFDPIEIQLDPIAAADILFVVDDSSTMAEEQAQLASELESLLALLGGRGDPRAPRSIHLGVVSGDLGLRGVTGVAGCEELGKDGVLQHSGAENADCARTLPAFLSFQPATEDLERTVTDLACITQLGTSGCGLQQPLEAAFKALTPAERGEVFFGAGHELGHGSDANVGFLRAGQGEERAVLAVVVVSDKDDCSLLLPERWAAGASFDASEAAQRAQQLNVRCTQLHDERLIVSRYEPAFGVPVDADQQFVFAAITGVPRFTGATDRLLETRDAQARDAIFGELLDDPRMQYQVDGHGNDDAADDTLVPVCEGNHGHAWPARRLVEMAQRSGANALVGSICENDFSAVIDGVRQRIQERLVGPCLDGPLQRDRDGLVACDLIWHIPPTGGPMQGPSSCDDDRFPFLMPDRDPLGSTAFDPLRCRVAQLRIATRDGRLGPLATEHDGRLFAEGWFYDDFSSDTARQCPGLPRRVALQSQEKPDPTQRITLECLQRATNPDPPSCRPLR